MSDLERRFLDLERQMRWWRWISIGSIAILTIILFLGQTKPVPAAIDAENIRFRDSEGHVRMELKRLVDGKNENFGLHFYDTGGTETGTFATAPGGSCCLSIKQLADYRKLMAIQAHVIMEKGELVRSMKPETKAQWEKDELAKIEKMGDTFASLNSEQMYFLDQSKGAGYEQCFGTHGLCTRSITVVRDDAKIQTTLRGMYPEESGLITVFDGRVEVLSSKNHQSAMLGSTDLEDSRTGATTSLPVSTLTLFDKDGKVLFQVPK